jgi:hypothetical protein
MDERDEAQTTTGRRWRWTPDTRATLAALAIVALGTLLRMSVAVRHSNAPMIDENEVVEQAVAFMGPDLHFYFLKYGPLTMYVLSGIYRVAALLHGMTSLDYASRVFFDGAEHYAIARIYALAWLEVLALAAFFFLRRQLGRAPALLGCTLLAFPFVEVLATGVRIDVPQAAFQALALLALTEACAGPRSRYWLLAGACAGLAIATKPLPGLLIAPSFLLASWFAAAQRPDGSARPLLPRLGAALAGRGLWLAALAAVLLAVLGNPTLIDIRVFIQSQREAVALHSGNALHARSAISTTFLMLEPQFLLLTALAAVLCAIARERRALLVGLFVAVYVGAFVGRASRTYFMVAPAAALCLLVGYGFARAQSWLGARPASRWLEWLAIPLALGLVYAPARAIYVRSERPSRAVEASRWMEANVPAGTRMFHLGSRAYGTYLLTNNEKVQSAWGDHFDYGRHRYRFLREAFHLAFENYAKSGRPRYAIEVRDEAPHPRSSNKNKRWITDGLLRRAREKEQKYIVIAGYRGADVRALGYPWFDQAVLEQDFGGIAIFRVPDAAPPAPVAPAAANLAEPGTAEPPSPREAPGAPSAPVTAEATTRSEPATAPSAPMR